MRRRHLLAIGCLLLLTLGAGCQGIDPPDENPTPPDHGQPADPASDRVGWEDGYWHNESIDVDQSDGLNDTEMDAYVARSMARVEVLRDREFQSRVPVSVISRAEYRNRSTSSPSDGYRAWNNQVWEAMLVVGEDEDVQDLLNSTYGGSVLGFYSSRNDQITIVTPTPDQPTVNNATLIHELAHAMQDQYHDLGSGRFGAPTQDGDLAASSIVEGEANYLEARYTERCGDDWACVASPSSDGGGGDGPPNWGISLTVYFPYSDGPAYVADLIEAGGWDAVDAAFAEPPASTEQVIHATDEEPVDVTVADTASDGWTRFDGQGDGGADTLGEASTYVAFWYQSRYHDAGVIDPNGVVDVESPYDTYDYRSGPSEGWAGDAVVPYENDGAYGYVWKSQWDSTAEAGEFASAYRSVLRAHDADHENGTYVVTEGPFADAFRIERVNETVTITNAPTADALDAVHRPDDAAAPPDAGGETTGLPGFGIGAALAAALAAALVALRRRV